jgi:hypothetical protein
MIEEDQEIQTRNLNAEIEQAKKAIAMRDALVRLESQPDFKTVIETGFFKDFSNNLVMQRGMPEMRGVPEIMEANTRKIDSIGELNHYFRGVKAMGAQSENSLIAARELESRLDSHED